MRATCSSPPWRGASCTASAPPPSMNTGSIGKDAALERRFQKVLVEEPSVEDTIAILRGLKERYELHHGVEITDPRHHRRRPTVPPLHCRTASCPDKAIDLIDGRRPAYGCRSTQAGNPPGPPRAAHHPAQDLEQQGADEEDRRDASRKRLELLNQELAKSKNTTSWEM